MKYISHYVFEQPSPWRSRGNSSPDPYCTLGAGSKTGPKIFYISPHLPPPPSFSNQIYYILKMIWDIILRIRIVYTSLRSRSLFLTRFMTFSWNQEKIHNPRWRRKGISPFCLAAECFHGWWLWSHLNELHPPQHNPFFFPYSQFSWMFGRPRFSNKLFFSLMTFNRFPNYWYIKLIYLKW